MITIEQIFETVAVDSVPPYATPRHRYLITFTPRSGSSYLCERLERTGTVGIPREILNKDLMPAVLKQIPARGPQEYLERVLAVRASPLGITGFKTTWHQFVEFTASMPVGHDWGGYQLIYLRREDLAAQAVSLYRAVGSNVFHTNIPIDEDARARLESLPYSYAGILHWYRHIVEQEQAWERYFHACAVDPLRIRYEQVHQDIESTLAEVLGHLGVAPLPDSPREASVFNKLAGSTSFIWADRFAEDHLRAEGVPVRRANP